MPASISGIVFNDLNSNGVFNAGEPGIANAFVTLFSPGGTCAQLQTDSSGNYSFTNLTVAGSYTVYETVVTPNACPPTQFTQPSGFNESTTPRQINLTVTSTQISGNTNISGNNFGHDNLTPNGCTPFAYQVQGTPTTFTQIDLKTGATSTLGTLNPSSTFAGTGYNTTDGNFWGYNSTTSKIGRITANRTVTDLPTVPNLPVPVNYNNGDVSSNGYLYLYSSLGTSFFVIDVNPNRATYGRLVNPATGFSEQTTAPFGVTIGTAINTADWAFNPQDGQLYGVNNTNGVAVRINPTTGVVTNLTTSPIVVTSYGASFFDNNNNLYEIDNTTGQVLKYALSGNTATRTLFSTSVAAGQNDGARCATAAITFAFLSSTKSAPGNVGIGETFTYTVAIKNTGNTTSLNCVFVDTIPNGLSLLPNTFKVNGSSKAGSPQPPGIELGSLPIGVTTVTFDVLVVTIPTPNPMVNNSTQSYSYQDGPGGAIFNANAYSNAVSTTVNYVILPSTKQVSKTDAAIGDVLTYTIVTKNTGNFTASNLFIRDTLPNGTAFVGGSLSGGTGTPATGITVGTLAPGATSTVIFNVVVNTLPSPNPIVNFATATITYVPNPTTGITKVDGSSTNSVSTLVSQAAINGITKIVDKAFGKIGDTLTYTLTFKNSGNTTATSVVFSDTLPTGTAFIPNSLFVNNQLQSGLSPAPPGISVQNLAPNDVTTIVFKALITTLPSPNAVINQGKVSYSFFTTSTPLAILSNNAVTTINMAQLSQSKQVNLSYAKVGDILTYTIPITNSGNTTANNIIFLDTIPNGTVLLSGTFKQDGTLISGSPAPPGVTLPSGIKGPGTSTVTFQVQVITLPNPNPIVNSATSSFNYTVNPSTPNDTSSSANTNSVATQVNSANLGNISKSADKAFANCGDIINYTITIPNSGNVTAQNIIFKDTIPNGTSFIPNSLKINNVTQSGFNPNTGVTVPNIGPGGTAVITFSVQVQC